MVIGYYVHHQGSGHLHRMLSIAAALDLPVTGISSLARPLEHSGPWLQLPRDDQPRPDGDVTAHGALHWAPLGHNGFRDRMQRIATWVTDVRPRALVVDVSAEVAALGRLLGVPVVVMAMRGDRSDRPHRLAYDVAEALVAPWPAAAPEPWPREVLSRTAHVGALSRFDGRPVAPADPGSRTVLCLWGGGGPVPSAQLSAAREATPGWRWVFADGSRDERSGDEVWRLLQEAAVVVCHAGQNAVAEVAAAQRPAVVIAQPRPFDEQQATVAALRTLDLAVALDDWPQPHDWPDLLARATALPAEKWLLWNDGRGAARAAEVLERVAHGEAAP